jgi:hypothetical protein
MLLLQFAQQPVQFAVADAVAPRTAMMSEL